MQMHLIHMCKLVSFLLDGFEISALLKKAPPSQDYTKLTLFFLLSLNVQIEMEVLQHRLAIVHF